MEEIKELFSIEKEADLMLILGSIMSVGLKRKINNVDLCMYVTAASELGTNLVKYANEGSLEVIMSFSSKCCLAKLVSRDKGPGIEDIEMAMTERYSTGKTLGLGLASCKRLATEFHIESSPQGTVIHFSKELKYV